MGLDTSAHPFDRNLLRERIIPFILEGEPIDDLIEQSVKIGLASWRANAWGLALHNYAGELRSQQDQILQPEYDVWSAAYQKQNNRGILQRLLGLGGREKDLPPWPLTILLPGFDSDLQIWGRPFFIVADTPEDVCAVLERYLSAAGSDDGIDEVAANCLLALEAKRQIKPDGARDDLWEVIANAPPLTALRLDREDSPPSKESLIAQADQKIARWQTIARESDLERPAEIEGLEVEQGVTFGDLQRELPFDIVNFMAGLTPGWMSRGYGFGSNLVDLVARGHGDLFETPAEPFAPLAEQLPILSRDFHDTIPENFSLGGYIPPERVPLFIDVLEEYREPMIFAFEKKPRGELTQEQFEMLQADWLKIREAAEYAARHKMGYLEAAEVYSGPLGWMN